MKQPRLLDQVREALRVRHYSLRTEESYTHWIKRFILFHNKRHPKDMGKPEVESFLSFLTTHKNVASSTQNQALSAILFLYKQVLKQEIDWIENVVRAKRPKRLPVVLPRSDVSRILNQLEGRNKLVGMMLYGAGMRLMEVLRLRVQDINFEYRQIIVRSGKGDKDRVTVLPEVLVEQLESHLLTVKEQHMRDLEEGFGTVYLPHALARKYPKADREWGWQYVFPSDNRSVDPLSGVIRRHHIYEKNFARAVKRVAVKLGMPRRVSSHTFRHCFATHLLEDGYDIRTVQELLGHKYVKTTMIYTHVMKKGAQGVKSPLESL